MVQALEWEIPKRIVLDFNIPLHVIGTLYKLELGSSRTLWFVRERQKYEENAEIMKHKEAQKVPLLEIFMVATLVSSIYTHEPRHIF